MTATACGPPGFEGRVRDYARLAVALGERDPDSIDFYYGPPQWVSEVRKNPPRLDQIRGSALDLARQLEPDPSPRTRRLARQLRAIAARADELLGVRESFEQRAAGYFGVTLSAASAQDPEPAREEIGRELPGHGSLAQRYAEFDRRFLVPADRLPMLMARAIRGCRDQTLQHVHLPAGEAVRVEYVHGKPWSGFSRYQGNFQSVISVNVDLPLTVDRALQLACHEAYPGHHVQNVLQDLRFVRDNGWMEWTVRPTFSPPSLIAESLATLAVNVAFPGAERLRFERDALFPIAGLDPNDAAKYDHVARLADHLESAELDIARDFIDGKLEWARAAAALEEQVLMAHPEETLKYISEYRTYVIAYTLGPELVGEQIHGWKDYEDWLTDPDAAGRIVMKP